MRISDWSSDVCSSDLSACQFINTSRQNLSIEELFQAWKLAQSNSDILITAGEGFQYRVVFGAEGCAHCQENTDRSEEHTSELQSLMRISYAVFCLKKKTQNSKDHNTGASTQEIK